MANVNKVFLLGNLTRDPDLRSTTSGVSVCNMGLAMNRRYTTAQGEDREETCFVDVEVWGRQAENCAKYLQKGRSALIEGRLQQDQWQDKNTGESRSKIRVRAETVQFLGSGGQGSSGEISRREESASSTDSRQEDSGQSKDMPQFEPVEEDDSQDNIPF